MSQTEDMIRELLDRNNELLECLKWMVANDETNEGDGAIYAPENPNIHGENWNELNGYWIAGLNRSRAAIKRCDPLWDEAEARRNA